MRIAEISFLIALMAGCAGGQTTGAIDIGTLRQDLFIIDIASNSQMDTIGGTHISTDANIPIQGFPTPLSADITRTGLLSGQSLKIDDVQGRIVIQRALVGSHNIPLEDVLPTLFVPSISPLGDIEFEETVSTLDNPGIFSN